MRINSTVEIENMGKSHGAKIAKLAYNKYGADAVILGDLLYDVEPEELIEADADYIAEVIGGMEPAQKRILRSVCNSIHKFTSSHFHTMEYEDDFADEYGDSPTTVFTIAFWNAFDKTLNRLQMH